MLHGAIFNFRRRIVNQTRGFSCRVAAQFKTNKDSIERSAPKMIECNPDVIARSLDAIGGWTSPGALLAFSFLCCLAETGYEE